MYQLHRVFCATSWELEGERRAFGDVLGEVNEREAMSRGVLYVPVSLVRMQDKRPFQYDVEDNIRACRHYILVLSGDWGPPERNFRRDYELACASSADPALPMRDVAVLIRQGEGAQPDPALPPATAAFGSVDEFREIVRGLLSRWVAAAAEGR